MVFQDRPFGQGTGLMDAITLLKQDHKTVQVKEKVGAK